MDTKSPEQAKQNWTASHGRIPKAYSDGVSAAKDVINKSIAAEENYAAGVQAAVAAKRRAKGLEKVSDADWKQAAQSKGSARIVAGMKASEAKYGRGINEVIGVLQSVNLPNRTQDPDANIDNRVKPIARALHSHFKE